jgi:hypothetical protein
MGARNISGWSLEPLRYRTLFRSRIPEFRAGFLFHVWVRGILTVGRHNPNDIVHFFGAGFPNSERDSCFCMGAHPYTRAGHTPRRALIGPAWHGAPNLFSHWPRASAAEGAHPGPAVLQKTGRLGHSTILPLAPSLSLLPYLTLKWPSSALSPSTNSTSGTHCTTP